MKVVITVIAALACQMAIPGGSALAGEIIIENSTGTVVVDPATSNADRAKGYAGNPSAGAGRPNVIVVTPDGDVAPGDKRPANSNDVLQNNSARAQSYARPQQNNQAPTVVIIAPDGSVTPPTTSDVQRNNTSTSLRNRARAKVYSGGVSNSGTAGSTVVIVPNQSGGSPGIVNHSAAEPQLDGNSARAQAWRDGRHGCTNATTSSVGTVGNTVIVGSSANADGVNTVTIGGGCQ